jgi:hypothetical protein
MLKRDSPRSHEETRRITFNNHHSAISILCISSWLRDFVVNSSPHHVDEEDEPRSREDAKKKTKPKSNSLCCLPSRLRAFAVHPPDKPICCAKMNNATSKRLPQERPTALRPKCFAARLKVPEKFQLLVDCKNEAEQRQLYEWLMANDYLCRVLVL